LRPTSSYREKSNVLEIEVKVKVEDLRPYREQLIALGAEIVAERALEQNILYDFRPPKLAGKKQALRLRTVRKKAFLTFKGTPVKSRKFKVREEFETEVKAWKQAQKILRALGLVPAFSYTKHRTVFRRGRLKICLDETPIGSYLEFEGAREEIAKFARTLRIPKSAWIKTDYVELLKKSGKKV